MFHIVYVVNGFITIVIIVLGLLMPNKRYKTKRLVICGVTIQDVWSNVPYKVVSRVTNDSSAYIVERLADGQVKIVNRLDLLSFTCSDDENPRTEQKSRRPTITSDDSSSDSSDDMFTITRVTEPQEPETTTEVRRSSRTTAGKHSNPHHLPRSVISQETSVVDYSDYADAILNLGKLLQKSYDKTTR